MTRRSAAKRIAPPPPTNADLQARIKATLEEFTLRITALARQAAAQVVMESIDQAMLGHPALGPRSRAHRDARTLSTTASAIDSDAAKVLAYVSANPGQRSEDIRAALLMERSRYQLVVRRLVEARKIVRAGEKRSARYRPA